MNQKWKIRYLGIGLVFGLLVSVTCAAQSVDQIPVQTGLSSQTPYYISSSTPIIISLLKDKSYECVTFRAYLFDTTGVNSQFATFLSAKTPSAGSASLTMNGDLYPAVSTPATFRVVQAATRVSLVAAESGDYTFNLVDSGTSGDAFLQLDCRETTLYGSYNRFFAQVAIVEIENRALSNVSVSISIVDSNGAVVVSKRSETARANTRTDVIFADLPASNFGQIVITHNAPAGALSGTVAEYDFGNDGSITLKRERPLTTIVAN